MITFLLLLFEPLFAAIDYLNNGLAWLHARIDRALDYHLLKRRFKRTVGYWPNLKRPSSFNEKIQWRKLNDHAPVYAVISDKYRLKEYITHRFGAQRAAAILPKWRLVTAWPTAAMLKAAGTGVVIKPNHGSGWVKIVPQGSDPDWRRLAWTARHWMRRRHGLTRHEWAYHGIKPLTLVEELVLNQDGRPAMDVKFQVMDGVCDRIEVIYDRQSGGRYVTATPDWQMVDADWKNYKRGDLLERPACFDEMRALAEEIGRDFDYIRVDFLCGATEWRLNELTLYESSGFAAFVDPNLELAYGKLWKQRKYDGVWGKSAPHDG